MGGNGRDMWTPGASPRSQCGGTVIIHVDGAVTCTNPECGLVAGSEFVHSHTRFVPCAAVFVDEPCPPCAGQAPVGD